MNRTHSPRRIAKALALAALGTLAASSVGGCAAALGIEDTKLQGVVVEDPCLEPIIPYFWYFAQPIGTSTTFPLRVVPQATWEALVGPGGFKLDYDPTRGHIVADARNCLGDPLNPDGAAGVRFEFRPVSGVEKSNFFFGKEGSPEPGRAETSPPPFSLGGVINATEGLGPFVAIPNNLADNAISASRAIRVRAGFLTTLRLEPNVDVPVPGGDVPPEWACVGKVAPPAKATAETTAIIGNVSNLVGGAPTPGIRFRICAANAFNCDLLDEETPDAVTDADGNVNISVPTPGGAPWTGYLVVKGKTRKSTPECK